MTTTLGLKKWRVPIALLTQHLWFQFLILQFPVFLLIPRLIVSIFTIVQLGAMDNINPVLTQIKEKTANTSGGFGYAATLSWVYSLIVLAIIGLTFLLFKERKSKVTHKYW